MKYAPKHSITQCGEWQRQAVDGRKLARAVLELAWSGIDSDELETLRCLAGKVVTPKKLLTRE